MTIDKLTPKPLRSSPGRYNRHIGGVALPEPAYDEEPDKKAAPPEGVPDNPKET